MVDCKIATLKLQVSLVVRDQELLSLTPELIWDNYEANYNEWDMDSQAGDTISIS